MIHWMQFIDVFLVVFVLALVFFFVRRTVLSNLYLLIIALFLLSELLDYYQLRVLSDLLSWGLQLAIIALLIVFQPELRKIFLRFASIDLGFKDLLKRKVKGSKASKTEPALNIEPVLTSLQNMMSARVGAILVFARKSSLTYYAESGVLMDAQINARLLEAIFQPTSPLHDGAVIIKNNRILSASAILPVSESKVISGRKGLRHRAAIGLVERTDAVSIVVSEETGKLFIAYDDFIEEDISIESLRKRLQRLFSDQL
ncbi:MAG: TIGR00159 family protein [Flavobacteriales bacterium]|nr:MAG: TIGR00159 family protein [Flavobacteriales bacterium]